MAGNSLNIEPAGNERRKSQRLQYNGKVEIEWGSATLSGTVRDISQDGMFIELMPPLWMGASFLARLGVTPTIMMHCTVRRVEPGLGNAVAFEIPEETGKAQLGVILASLIPL